MSQPFKLTRTKQCKTCPWKKDADPFDIPGYDEQKHRDLKSSIAQGLNVFQSTIKVMACHYSEEGDEQYCIGWLQNQLGDGNNIALRLVFRNCENYKDIETYGPQHQNFEDTLPD